MGMAPRRKSGPKASPAKPLTGESVLVEEYAKAWDSVTSAIDSLKSNGHWVSSGTAPGTVPGLTNVLPNDFKGKDVPADTKSLSSNSSCRLAVLCRAQTESSSLGLFTVSVFWETWSFRPRVSLQCLSQDRTSLVPASTGTMPPPSRGNSRR